MRLENHFTVFHVAVLGSIVSEMTILVQLSLKMKYNLLGQIKCHLCYLILPVLNESKWKLQIFVTFFTCFHMMCWSENYDSTDFRYFSPDECLNQNVESVKKLRRDATSRRSWTKGVFLTAALALLYIKCPRILPNFINL